MATVTPESVLEQLQWRYATKRFDPTRTIPADLWQKLEDAMLLAPSSFGMQPWKFIVVTDKEIRSKLRQAAWNQPQLEEASHIVVFAGRQALDASDADRHTAHTAAVRNVPVDSLLAFRDMMAGTIAKRSPEQTHHWAARQVYIALGVFITVAAMVGVDTCPMEGFGPEKFDEILGLKSEGYTSLVLAAAGYRSPDDKYAVLPKVRYHRKDTIRLV